MSSPEESADVLIAIFLFAVDVLRIVLIAVVAWLVIPRHRACPQCGEPTAPLETPRILRWLLLEKRWCIACGWSGIARRLPGILGPEAPAQPPSREASKP